MVSDFAQVGGDILTNLFYQYVQERGADSLIKTPRGPPRVYNRTMNATKAGGRRAPARVNAKNGAWVKYGKERGKDAKKLATRGWVKKTLALDNVGKEVTVNSGSIDSGASPVFFRMGKNIDAGTAQAGRLRNVINYLGIRLFGSIQLVSPAEACRIRFLIMEDSTPTRSKTEAFFSTNSDARDPVDFPLGPPASFDAKHAVWPINPDRWKVRADWVEHVAPKGDHPTAPQTLVFNRYFKINRKFYYNDDFNTASEDLSPNMYLVYYSVGDTGIVSATTAIDFHFEEYFSN